MIKKKGRLSDRSACKCGLLFVLAHALLQRTHDACHQQINVSSVCVSSDVYCVVYANVFSLLDCQLDGSPLLSY